MKPIWKLIVPTIGVLAIMLTGFINTALWQLHIVGSLSIIAIVLVNYKLFIDETKGEEND